ncbi:hypothetical protein [Rubinisphaera italica]|uniref:DNA-directed RNA polymerase n=1 Tax=Rubinisphaera italica TaxID=2527969 RepID=A0A5C5XQR0_9PLAN|nr:hypothetical protein [Rubinisphaera italica]TWT64415.1 hypothetical protein Pan54_51770 [Rubinisphaera italica]
MIAKTKRTKPVCVYNPVNFEPESVLPKRLRRHADSARYVLHRIHWGQVTKKANERGFVPLKRAYLRSFIPHRIVRPLIGALIDAEVIESDRYFVPGHKSYGYRFAGSYFRAPVVRLPLSNTKLIEHITHENRSECKKVRLDVHRYLRTQLKSLQIDLDRALVFLEHDEHRELLKIPAFQIATGERLFSVCRYGRIHTDLTHLKSTLRPCLHVDGKRLVSIDIRNSQPLFLALLILIRRLRGETFLSLSTLGTQSNPYRTLEDRIATIISPLPPPTPLSNTMGAKPISVADSPFETRLTTDEHCRNMCPVNRDTLSLDEARFLTLCECGQLYESLMEEAEIPVRRWAKEMIFEVLFGRNRSRSELKTRFAELFPTVYDTVKQLKRKDHCRLAHLLQNLESTVVINRVCRRLMNEKVSPVFTIHDSILTTDACVERVLDVFQEVFAALGVAPSFHVTRYDQE